MGYYTTRRTSELVTKLQEDLGSDAGHFRQLLREKLGTSRDTEVLGAIGDNGQPFDKQLQEYIISL